MIIELKVKRALKYLFQNKKFKSFFKNKEKDLTSEIEKYIKEKQLYLIFIITPPVQAFLQPVVSGNEIGNFKIALIAKKAKAWDSTKSPSTP